MELYEKGIITKKDTDGLSLGWDDADDQIELIHRTAMREGFGNLVAEGMYSMAKIIGKKQLISFFKKEGVALREELDPQDVILGKGYVIEKSIILSMYNRNVPKDYNSLFPYTIHTTEIRMANNSFEFRHVPDAVKAHPDSNYNAWVMPSLVNLPMKTALEKLAIHTSKIKIHGSGLVVEQQPKAFEKMKGETECVIHGRPYR